MTYQVQSQKSYKGRSANQILGNAEVAEMRGGNVEITISDMPGVIAQQSDSGNLVLSDVNGIIAVIECGARAADRLESLTQEAERLQDVVNNR